MQCEGLLSLIGLSSTSVFLITGGENTELYLSSVEVFVPSTGFSCMLDGELPYVYLYGHVQAGLEVCGGESAGGGSLAQCQVWEGGQWEAGHQLSQERLLSQVWHSSTGPVILAGSLVETNTWAERLAGGGTVVPHYLELEQRLESVTPLTPHTTTYSYTDIIQGALCDH